LFSSLSSQLRKELGEKVVLALNRNNFKAFFCKDRSEALLEIKRMIPSGSSVGTGGSMTISEMGMVPFLIKMGHKILDHNIPGSCDLQKNMIRKARLTCDVFLTSANAVTIDGQLVNTDGLGTRIAPMVFGPKRVIVVAGVNKIVENVDDAMKRIMHIAAPMNNRRRMRPNPCTQTGECIDCSGPERICNVTCILHKRPPLSDIHVLIVGERLGF
jgi:hypothetical protein